MQPTPETFASLVADAERLAEVLRVGEKRAVFAESCTAGLVSATLARVPGISEFLCGSAVTYRIDAKIEWLGVTSQALAHAGVVSSTVAKQMATGVLGITPEADIAAAITGHLGPNAPTGFDGLVYVGVAVRGEEPDSVSHVLDVSVPAEQVRVERQHLAAQRVLDATIAKLLPS